MYAKINGVGMRCIKADTDPDGVRVELWAKREYGQITASTVWAVRLIDLDSAETIGTTTMEGDDAARVAFNHYTTALRGY